MGSLGNIFRRYTGFLRALKPVYVLNNLLNRQQLQHNKALYEKYGLHKSIYAPIGSGDFPQPHPDIPWLDRPDALEALRQHPDYADFPTALRESLQQFVTDGFMILPGFIPEAQVEKVNKEIAELLAQRSLDFNYTGRKIMESYKHSDAADALFRDPRLLKLLNFIMGKPILPFHTINFIEGSEQRPHSDSIHMSTEPKGYLIAAWFALEDIGSQQGPLVYYPGSHRLPYITTQDYPSGNTHWTIGAESNKRFEDKIETLIAEHQLQPATFEAKKGDVLIWHANLIHGGSAIEEPGATRKSMVAHYFCEEVICYHEISQRPALLDRGK